MTEEDIIVTSVDNITRTLRHAQPQVKRDFDFKKYPSISKAGDEVKKYLEEHSEADQDVIGGSSAAYAQVRKFRKPKDIDLHTHKMYKTVRELTTILRSKYGNAVVVTPMKILVLGNQQTKLIQIKIKDRSGKLHDAIDVKSVSGEDMPYMDFSLSTIQVIHKPIRIGKLLYEPVGELISKKGRTIKEQYVGYIKRGELPSSRTKKDIDDFLSFAKSYKKEHPTIVPHVDNFMKNLRYYGNIPTKEEEEKLKLKKKAMLDPLGAGEFNIFGNIGGLL